MGDKEKMVLKDETYAIIGACMEVHKTLGRSFSEKVYQDALEQEYKLRNIVSEEMANTPRNLMSVRSIFLSITRV